MAVSNQFWLSTLQLVIVVAAAAAASPVYTQLKHPFWGPLAWIPNGIEMYLTASHSAVSYLHTNTHAHTAYEKCQAFLFDLCSVLLFLFWRSQNRVRMNGSPILSTICIRLAFALCVFVFKTKSDTNDEKIWMTMNDTNITDWCLDKYLSLSFHLAWELIKIQSIQSPLFLCLFIRLTDSYKKLYIRI